MDASAYLVFPVLTGVAFVAALGLLACAVKSAEHAASPDERSFRAFKRIRVGTYAGLVGLQAALVAARQYEHWPSLTAVDADGTCVLLLYVVTLVVVARCRNFLGLRLSGVLMLTMLQVGVLLAQDAAPGPGGGGELFDGERIARVSLHGLQLVMLLMLLVSEVIVQQHQLLTRSSYDGHYQPLLDPEEAGHGARGKRWRPGDGRWQMAAGAFRYVWPSTGMLRARLLACFALVMVERCINLAVPILFKNMVEALSEPGQPSESAPAALARRLAAAVSWLAGAAHSGGGGDSTAGSAGTAVGSLQDGGAAAGGGLAGGGGLSFWGLFYPWAFYYLGTLFLRGGAGGEGLLADVRDILWIPITQAAFRRISLDVFGHLLALDLHWHLHRKTGQVMRILDRGTTSIQDTVSIILFNVLPSMIDIVVACSYLAGRMEPWVALIVLVTVSSYVPLTVLITERRGKVRKVMNALDNEREGRATDVLLNYETVKYFCNEGFELAGYDTATRKYQAAEYWQMVFLSLLSMVQASVVWVGMAAGLAVCVRGVARGTLTVGDTVLFVTMMQQLYVPLTFFGSYYRQVQKALIDMENMFELLATEPRTKDDPAAPPLRVAEGRVDFRDVVFGYHATNPVLKGVSFSVPGSTTLAVVGSTGSGKSTILRLLLRFYDPQSGGVFIDGQNIRHASQSSVRGAIAVVPQDTVLFNETILYNIRYGKPSATDAQVHEAARVAHIHQHLLTFPNGYQTRVGERGLRLSGGEKQRVAFARAVLKGPAVLVLDEATSALDSLTERLIQSSLQAIRGRCTTLLVAHRLSTVMDADQILVLEKGLVAEVGSHTQLLERGGLYAAMWARQQADGASYCASPDPPPPEPPLEPPPLPPQPPPRHNGGAAAPGGRANGAGSGMGVGAGLPQPLLGDPHAEADAEVSRRTAAAAAAAPGAGSAGSALQRASSGSSAGGGDGAASSARSGSARGAGGGAGGAPQAPSTAALGHAAYVRASSSIQRYRMQRQNTDADSELTTPAMTPRGALSRDGSPHAPGHFLGPAVAGDSAGTDGLLAAAAEGGDEGGASEGAAAASGCDSDGAAASPGCGGAGAKARAGGGGGGSGEADSSAGSDSSGNDAAGGAGASAGEAPAPASDAGGLGPGGRQQR